MVALGSYWAPIEFHSHCDVSQGRSAGGGGTALRDSQPLYSWPPGLYGIGSIFLLTAMARIHSLEHAPP
jgi:hypothetical protein